MEIGPGSPTCVAAWSASRTLDDLVAETPRMRVRPEDHRHLDEVWFIAYTDAEPAAIRDWFGPRLLEAESAFVAEFGRRPACGPAPDQGWLLVRGH